MTWVRTLALGSLIVLTLPAPAAPQGEATTMTIRLISTATYSKVLTDRPPTNEASKGDVLVVGSALRNAVAQFGRSKGAAVGKDTVILTIRSRTRADVIVESTLPGGWLRAAGHVRLGPRQTYPVTGGGEGSRTPVVREKRSPWFTRAKATKGSRSIGSCCAEPTIDSRRDVVLRSSEPLCAYWERVVALEPADCDPRAPAHGREYRPRLEGKDVKSTLAFAAAAWAIAMALGPVLQIRRIVDYRARVASPPRSSSCSSASAYGSPRGSLRPAPR